jgi:hypothetical protein
MIVLTSEGTMKATGLAIEQCEITLRTITPSVGHVATDPNLTIWFDGVRLDLGRDR